MSKQARFHACHGINIELSKGNKIARVKDHLDGKNTVLFSALPLVKDVPFNIKVDKAGPFPVLMMGVTTKKPVKSEVSEFAWQAPGGRVVDDWGGLCVEGDETGKYSTGPVQVKTDDIVGVEHTENGSVIIHHNGSNQGVAFTEVKDPVWACIGLGFNAQISATSTPITEI